MRPLPDFLRSSTMGGKTMNQYRACTGEFELWPADDTRGWKPVRRGVSFAEGIDKVAQGKWILHEHQGQLWYFQLVPKPRLPQKQSRRFSPTTITARESLLSASGGSATAKMDENDPRRLRRYRKKDDSISPISGMPFKPLAPEDAVERAQAKVRQWPHPASRIDDGTGVPVFGDRAVRVYPKPA